MDIPDSPEDNRSAKAPTEFRWWRVLLGVFLFWMLWLGFVPCQLTPKVSMRNQKDAVNNAREVHKELWSFMEMHGRFPSPETIEEVRKSTDNSIPLGTVSSNDYLRQLVVNGADERIFYSGSKRFRRPDGRVNGQYALEKGECGFAYVVGIQASDDLSMPVLIGPVIPGEKRFDSDAFNRKVALLRLDGSVVMTVINIHGHIALGGGKSIDPANPQWNGKPLTIAWPE